MINWDKPIQTRDGRKARFLYRFVVGKDIKRELVLVLTEEEYPTLVDAMSGQNNMGVDFDIINVPERIERWVNVQLHVTHIAIGNTFKSESEAILYSESATGTVKLTIEDGKLISAEVVE